METNVEDAERQTRETEENVTFYSEKLKTEKEITHKLNEREKSPK
jgi:hypothetical protein